MFDQRAPPRHRDPASLGMALAMPVMMLPALRICPVLDVDHIPTLVYDQDGTAASRDLTRQFQASQYFDVIGFVNDYPPLSTPSIPAMC